jgi:hypothetical protein
MPAHWGKWGGGISVLMSIAASGVPNKLILKKIIK